MSRINDLRAKGFELLDQLNGLIRQKETILAKEMSWVEVQIEMSSHYQRQTHRRKKVMKGIETMHPEIKN